MKAGILLLLATIGSVFIAHAVAANAPAWSCNLFGCTCQGMADYYGVKNGYGFGCAPPPAQDWWSNKEHCSAASKCAYCKGPACSMSGAHPCEHPGPSPSPSPPPTPPSPPAQQCQTWNTDASKCLSYYNVIWTELYDDSKLQTWENTMPIGNGRFAANAWVDFRTSAASTPRAAAPSALNITALLSAGAAWSEAGELLKVGMVTVSIEPNPMAGSNKEFKQTLDLATGTMIVEAGDVTVNVYISAADDDLLVFDVRHTLGDAVKVTAAVTNIRPAATSATPSFDCQAYTTSADVVAAGTGTGGGVGAATTWYHHNPDASAAAASNQSYFANVIKYQNLGTEAADSIPDGLAGRTFGGALAVKTVDPANTVVVAALGVEQIPTAELASFTSRYAARASAAAAAGPASTIKPGHDAWWTAFWGRSHVEIKSANSSDTSSSPFLITRQFIVQRYIVALQARSPFPIKFNGMLFTANKPASMGGPGFDYRQWGGLNWWQNLRSPYYAMLGNGDADLLTTLFESFLRSLPLARARVEQYYNYTGAFWPEYTHALFGTTHPNSYGCNRAGGMPASEPIGYSEDPWNHYNLQGGLDLSLFILDHYTWTENATAFARYLPIVESVVEFYSHRWQHNGLDHDGKMIMFPTQAVETWQCPGYPPNVEHCVTNDAPTVAGITEDQRAAWVAFSKKIPPVPSSGTGADAILEPGSKLPPGTSNSENAEMYNVHPYRIFSAGKQGVDNTIAKKSFSKVRFKSNSGWCQLPADAAILGLGSLSDPMAAPQLVASRAAVAPAAGYRFPAFMPHFQDYMPSADHLGIFSGAVVNMLLLPADDAAGSAVLLPAWPCGWDVDFKLAGPKQAVVSGSMKAGVLSWSVVPSARKPFITAAACQK